MYPRQDSQQNDYAAQQYRSGEVANEDNTADNECDTDGNTEIDALVFLCLDSAEQVADHNDKGQFGELRGLKRDAENLYPTGGTINLHTQTGESQEQKDERNNQSEIAHEANPLAGNELQTKGQRHAHCDVNHLREDRPQGAVTLLKHKETAGGKEGNNRHQNQRDKENPVRAVDVLHLLADVLFNILNNHSYACYKLRTAFMNCSPRSS